MAKFSEVLTIVNGKNQNKVENPNGKYPIYGSGGVMGYADEYICEANTVIIGRKGSINKPIFVETPFWNVDTAFGLVADKEKLLPKYLFYFCDYYDFEQLSTTVTIPSLTKANLLNVELPLPSLVEQEKILNQLSKVDSLISLRKQQLAKLDELVKARFVELFGEPLDLLDSGKTIPLDKAFSRITVGFVGEAASSYVEVGIPYLRTQNVRKGYIDFSGLIYVSEEFHNTNQKSKIKPGDIVVSRVGVNRGMAAVIPQELEEANIANCLIISKEDSVNSTYLAYYLNMSYGLSPKFGASVGSAQGVINTAILKKWEVFLPPFAQQEQFAAFVEQTDKSKSAIQQSLDKLETLKAALMQKYFG